MVINLTLLHSERPKLYRVLAVLSAIDLRSDLVSYKKMYVLQKMIAIFLNMTVCSIPNDAAIPLNKKWINVQLHVYVIKVLFLLTYNMMNTSE